MPNQMSSTPQTNWAKNKALYLPIGFFQNHQQLRLLVIFIHRTFTSLMTKVTTPKNSAPQQGVISIGL